MLLEPDDVPAGLTLAEVQSVMGDLFDSVADGTRGVYQKHLAYFGRWCQGRGIRQSLVEMDHIKVYVMEMREGRGLSVSWLGCAKGQKRREIFECPQALASGAHLPFLTIIASEPW